MCYTRWILLLGLCLAFVMGQEDTCHLSCNNEYDLVNDPFDCFGFYMCTKEGLEGPVLCPEKRPFFNGVHCTGEINTCCRHKCLPYCAHEGLEVADPLDCGSFYICLEEGFPSEELHFQCGPGKVFDASVGHCVAGKQCKNICNLEEALGLHKSVDERVALIKVDFDISSGDITEVAHMVEEAIAFGGRVQVQPQIG